MAEQSVAASTAIPFKAASAGDVGWQGGGLVLLISVLAIVIVQWLRRRLRLTGGAPGARKLRLLESLRLGPQSVLSVVEYEGTRYLLAQGAHGISCVAQLPAGEAS